MSHFFNYVQKSGVLCKISQLYLRHGQLQVTSKAAEYRLPQSTQFHRFHSSQFIQTFFKNVSEINQQFASTKSVIYNSNAKQIFLQII